MTPILSQLPPRMTQIPEAQDSLQKQLAGPLHLSSRPGQHRACSLLLPRAIELHFTAQQPISCKRSQQQCRRSSPHRIPHQTHPPCGRRPEARKCLECLVPWLSWDPKCSARRFWTSSLGIRAGTELERDPGESLLLGSCGGEPEGTKLAGGTSPSPQKLLRWPTGNARTAVVLL